MNSFATNLKNTWELRRSGELEKAYLSYRLLLEKISLRPEVFEKDFSQLSEEAAKCGILYCSLLRAQGSLDKSNELLLKVSQDQKWDSLSYPFDFNFESGLNNLISGNWSTALDYFVRAHKQSGANFDKMNCLINILLCLENLGLPFNHTLTEIKELLNSDKTLKGRDQILCFETRQLFRSGEIDRLFKQLGELKEKSGQIEYYQLWLSALPYHIHSGSMDANLEKFVTGGSYLINRSFRQRTLKGLLHPQDEKALKASDWADRLYLWTWKWLENSDKMSIEKVFSLFENYRLEKLEKEFTTEDRQMVINSLLWITLFNKRAGFSPLQIVDRLEAQKLDWFAIFEVEFLLIHYFLALKEGKKTQAEDYLASLQSSVVFNNGQFIFKKLTDGKLPKGTLQQLQQRLKVFNVVAGQTKFDHLVDLESCRINSIKTKASVISEPLCRTLELLRSREYIECAELLEKAFGIRGFDSFIHQPKINNLIARTKKILGDGFQFKVKDSKVFASGPWHTIQFIGNQKASIISASGSALSTFFKGDISAIGEPLTEDVEFVQALEALKGLDWFSREMLERKLARPRSTVNRWLKYWLKVGKISKTGNARNTQYRFGKNNEV